MSETQCKTRSGLLMAAMCLGCLLFTLPTVARCEEPDDKGFVPLFNGQDWSGWETTGNWAFEPDGVLILETEARKVTPVPGLQVVSLVQSIVRRFRLGS